MGWGLGALQRTGPRVVGQGLRTLLGWSWEATRPGTSLRPHKAGKLLFLPVAVSQCLGTKGVGRSPWGLVKKGKKAKHPTVESLCVFYVVSMKTAP